MDRHLPASTYRIQLSAACSLKTVLSLVPYFHALGIEWLYLSPFFEASTPGGYDITHPSNIDPKLGSLQDLENLSKELKDKGMGLLIDVVPNHMGMKGGKNLWWQDVLENGVYSRYQAFFDIDWDSDKVSLKNKILLPLLHDLYGKVLTSRSFRLRRKKGTLELTYFDFVFPLNPESIPLIGCHQIQILQNELKSSDLAQYQELMALYKDFPTHFEQREVCKKEAEAELNKLIERCPPIRHFIDTRLALFNGTRSEPPSFELLHQLLEAQHYRLAFWRTASPEINYRRFFNINHLVALRIEEPWVFERHHKLIFELAEKKIISGMRIDHPDGLYDPVHYLASLRERFADMLLLVEKILMPKEELAADWPVDGSVGYDFSASLNGLFIKMENKELLTTVYEAFIQEAIDFSLLLYERKRTFVKVNMASELNALGKRLEAICEKKRLYRDLNRHDLTEGLQHFIASLPTYRTYITENSAQPSKRDAYNIKMGIERAKWRTSLDPLVFQFLQNLLLLRLKLPKEEMAPYLSFICHLQQISAPAMAKGLEDSACYLYNRLLSLNEVGSSPEQFGITAATFHEREKKRQKKWPYSLLAGSSHDTKRSEDVRMRLNVLSEIPKRYNNHLISWAKLNAKLKVKCKVQQSEPSVKAKPMLVPCPNMEYYLYQTLLGAWPLEESADKVGDNFFNRIESCMIKSVREAGVYTNQIRPDLHYEKGVKIFLKRLLVDPEGKNFRDRFIPFARYVSRLGAFNSLSALIVKIGSSGIFDLYQGSEMWSYRLVDPDNRNEIDYSLLKDHLKKVHTLDSLKNAAKKEALSKLLDNDPDDLLKLYCIHKGLLLRRAHKALLLDGDYIPLKMSGKKKDHLISFARVHGKDILIVVAGRFFADLITKQSPLALGKNIWQTTEIQLPSEWHRIPWSSLLDDNKISFHKSLKVAMLMETLPFVLLQGKL